MNSDDANLLLCALFSQKATVDFRESEWVEPDHIFLLIGGEEFRIQVDPFSHPVLTDTIREALQKALDDARSNDHRRQTPMPPSNLAT